MFLLDHEMEKETLRQGDILSEVHILGAINPQAIIFHADQKGDRTGWAVPKAPEFSDVAVLSHSCEVDRANAVKVTSLILAPLRAVHTATDKEKLEQLIRSNIIVAGLDATFLKYFYVEPSEKLEHKEGAVIDFSKCFSVRKNAYETLLSKKKLQLNVQTSDAMALKLSMYFYRAQAAAA